MSTLRARTARFVGASLLLALAAGCGKNQVEDFPLSVGYQPLESLVAAALPPAPVGADLYPEGLGAIVAPAESGHFTSHARGYVHAPLAKVYQALHDPASSLIHNTSAGPRLDGPPVMDVEPSFPVSFRVRYSNATVVGDVKFDVTYRAGPLQGTDAAPVVIGQRYQKTWGTSNIRVMSGSLVATAVAGAPDVTEVEMIAWLDATTQHQSDCDGTLSDLFGDLVAVVAALP
jgi:hypothetical protein